jgi:hypothetical protein
MATSQATKHTRIEVRLPANASLRQTRELGAFARYCVQRIEKELGERQRWLVEIELGSRGYAALVEVEHHGLVIEARGRSQDAPLAVWDAVCRIEQDLRERRGAVFTARPAAPAND